MVVYTFNNNDVVLRKMKVIKIKNADWDWNSLHLVVEKDKCEYHMKCSDKEGKVVYRTFWLNEEDDAKAETIYRNYIKQKMLKELKKLERDLQKWG